MEILVTITDTLTEHLQPEEPTAKQQLQRLLLEEAVAALYRAGKLITGCKFSVAQMLCSSAQIEGNRIRRERCAEKNAWDSEPA